jgi:signal transduction histidine kinase
MSSVADDPRWPKLLSLAVHEFRTPITVVAGYIRMLLMERAGSLNDSQRRLLQEAEKSCGRLSGLVAEMSELSHLETGDLSFNTRAVDLDALLKDTIDTLPPQPDYEVTIELANDGCCAAVHADPARLKTAFASLLRALRRELVTANRLFVRCTKRDIDGKPALWIAIGGADQVERLAATDASGLSGFDEWRGGCGLSLAIARRIIAAHAGRVWSPPDGEKSAAVVMLPASEQARSPAGTSASGV